MALAIAFGSTAAVAQNEFKKVESYSELSDFLSHAQAKPEHEHKMKRLATMAKNKTERRQTSKYIAMGLLGVAIPTMLGSMYFIQRHIAIHGNQLAAENYDSIMAPSLGLGAAFGLVLISDSLTPYGFWDSPAQIISEYNDIRADDEPELMFEPIGWFQRLFATSKKWTN